MIINNITTLGNYAVLLTAEEASAQDLAPEHLVPAQGELTGYYWRQLTRPDYAALADKAMGNPESKAVIAKKLAELNDKRHIFFTDDAHLIERHILKNSYGTVSSLHDLANKDHIILLGSEGRRKYTPLGKSVARLAQAPDKTAIIGIAAESGVDLQPVGHEQTLKGADNRLKQLACFRETLITLLDEINPKPRTIACLSVESGIGLLPVEKINANTIMQIATAPLYSKETSMWHFYDQTHIVLDTQHARIHDITRPAYVNHTLISARKEELMSWFENGKPTGRYYLKQSQWSRDMLARMKSDPVNVFPKRKDGDKMLDVSDLIEERLDVLLRPIFLKKRTNQIAWTMGALMVGVGLFAAACGYANQSGVKNESASMGRDPT